MEFDGAQSAKNAGPYTGDDASREARLGRVTSLNTAQPAGWTGRR
eukprot:SAG22_NODE_5961_length_925_cov_1.198547_1_plen_44_part_10